MSESDVDAGQTFMVVQLSHSSSVDVAWHLQCHDDVILWPVSRFRRQRLVAVVRSSSSRTAVTHVLLLHATSWSTTTTTARHVSFLWPLNTVLSLLQFLPVTSPSYYLIMMYTRFVLRPTQDQDFRIFSKTKAITKPKQNFPDSPKPNSPKLGLEFRVRVRVSANRVSANRDWTF